LKLLNDTKEIEESANHPRITSLICSQRREWKRINADGSILHNRIYEVGRICRSKENLLIEIVEIHQHNTISTLFQAIKILRNLFKVRLKCNSGRSGVGTQWKLL
jgi:hypothetical protein